MQWNACVHRLDLGLYFHPKEFWGNGVKTHVKSPLPEKKSPQRRIEATTLHQAGQRAQHTPNELFRPHHRLMILRGMKVNQSAIVQAYSPPSYCPSPYPSPLSIFSPPPPPPATPLPLISFFQLAYFAQLRCHVQKFPVVKIERVHVGLTRCVRRSYVISAMDAFR